MPHTATTSDDQVRSALRVVNAKAARAQAAASDQTDLESFTGVAAEQEEREAVSGGIAADRLRSIVERIERLEDERANLASDIKEIRQEAKSAGFDVKVIGQIIAQRKKDPAEVEEQESMLDLYRRALGM